MRWFSACCLLLLANNMMPLCAQEKKLNPRDIDKQIFDVLKDVHNRGADLYNAGFPRDSYRLFQGTLQTTRALLIHRPAEQKFIDDALAEAEKIPAIANRAFSLHESIEKLRDRLRVGVKDVGPEHLTVSPREYKQVKAKEPVPKKFVPPKDGVFGTIVWRGTSLTGAEITFVSRGSLVIRVYEAVTDPEGQYVLDKVHPGKYTVLLTMPGGKKVTLPERYATTTTSPLIADVKGGGDRLDFLLQ